jgi:hypothetical protein
MTLSAQPSDPYTPAAAKRWKKVPEWAQEHILNNVFCTNCLGSVPIILETAEMKKKDLILRGQCKHCGKDVCRVVEPEDE